ncbi:Far upstream element-binding protein 1-like [Oopsacas minuta]|uniref:Far upstream element-binding protein 1-like n=1 Tax=Oopsacas minuta TaxID=111878 RepID=A0AAV7K771_9METZ|nr:Far upstream element-binding protein 1-like [Oopsacas minuta]
MEQNENFADAVRRAREIAAKMNNPNGSEKDMGGNMSRKRGFNDEVDLPESKRALSADPDDLGKGMNRVAWARDGTIKYETDIPSRYVGLVIGKGGETITKLQQESQAVIQVAPDPPDGLTQPQRHVTISGREENVEIAKRLINKIIDDANIVSDPPLGMGSGQKMETQEMMIPAGKVGLVIGKGGEMIKSLQEQASCKMQMIQDGGYQGAPEKPLRLQGNHYNIEKGKQLVRELLDQKDAEARGLTGDFSGPTQTLEIQVPRDLVGVIIGRQGETIRQIQTQSGARLQFQNDSNATSHRIATLTGPPDAVQKGQLMVSDVMNEVIQKQGKGGPTPNPQGPGVMTVSVAVPAGKCGLVIGKGGEKIRELQRQSGAHIEINKATQNNPHERLFNIRGTQAQINHSQVLIRQVVENSTGAQTTQSYAPVTYPANPAQSAVYPYQLQGAGAAANPWAAFNFSYPGQQAAAPTPTSTANTAANAAMSQQMKEQQLLWTAYYQQYYAAMAAAQQQGGTPGQAGVPQPGATPAQQAQSGAQPGATAGIPQDLQTQWADYFRQLGYQYPVPGQPQPKEGKN